VEGPAKEDKAVVEGEDGKEASEADEESSGGEDHDTEGERIPATLSNDTASAAAVVRR
jgi:hypothetical protein